MELRLSDIVASGRLDASEAVGLALAISAQLHDDALASPRRPSRDDVVLTSDGEVALVACDLPIESGGEARWLAGLVYDLIGLESDDPTPREPVPGALMLQLARALGRTPLPPTSYPQLLDALTRFGAPDRNLLAALHARLSATVPVGAAASLHSPLDAGPPEPWAVSDPPMFAAWPVSTYQRRPSRVPLIAAAAAVCLIAVGALALSATWRSGAGDQQSTARVAEAPAEEVSGTAGSQNGVGDAAGASGQNVTGSTGVSASGMAATTEPLPALPAEMRASLDRAGAVVAVAPALESSIPRHHVTPSPDGRWIAYDAERDGVSAVYVAQRDGTAPRQLSGAGHAAIPTWSPDGQRLVFLKAEADRTRVWNLWVVDMRRGALQRLTSHSVGQPKGAAWFPGGDRIVYGVDDTMVIVDIHGGGSTRIKSPVAGRLVRTPAVSPDGTRIVFQVFRDGAWMYDLTSGESRRILDDSSAEAFAWSPDGQRLVYHSFANGRWSVYQTSLREDGAAAVAAPIVQ